MYGSARPSYIKRLDTIHNQGLITPPWKLIVPIVCFDLCKYMKSETDPTLYRLYYSELLESFTDYTHIFTDGYKDGDKTASAFICQSFEFSKRT